MGKNNRLDSLLTSLSLPNAMPGHIFWGNVCFQTKAYCHVLQIRLYYWAKIEDKQGASNFPKA